MNTLFKFRISILDKFKIIGKIEVMNMLIEYKGKSTDRNNRVAQINFKDKELETLQKLAEIMNDYGYNIEIDDRFATCEVESENQFKEFMRDWKQAKQRLITTTGGNLDIKIDNSFATSYNFSSLEKSICKQAAKDVKETITNLFKDSTTRKEVDYMFKYLADAYPRSMDYDDGEKVVIIDEKNQIIGTVKVSMFDNSRTKKFEVELEPHTYSFDEFSREELEDLGIY